MLARTGIGHFVLYEYDTYSPTNMNRQIACFTDTLGVNKAVAIREMILRINPEAEVCAHQEALKTGGNRSGVADGGCDPARIR